MGMNRASSKPPAVSSSKAPFVTAVLLASALALGVGTLVARGRMAWPPTQLLGSLFTIAGSLALVGPLVLFSRKGTSTGGVGELIWMSGGLLIWVFDGAALVRGGWRTLSPATPLGSQTMGLTILAVLLAGCRWRSNHRDWSWTNVTGWMLGLFWIGMGLASMAPAGAMIVSTR